MRVIIRSFSESSLMKGCRSGCTGPVVPSHVYLCFRAPWRKGHKNRVTRVSTFLETGTATDTGCLVRDTVGPAKVRFGGRQMEGYRFVLCVLEGVAVGHDTVVRHRCHNRRCFNPDHLQFGTQADNKRDDWEFAANGVDFDLL